MLLVLVRVGTSFPALAHGGGARLDDFGPLGRKRRRSFCECFRRTGIDPPLHTLRLDAHAPSARLAAAATLPA